MITTPAYCNRDDVARALDIEAGIADTARVDEAVQGAARDIEGALHRLFYPWDGTKRFSWPNGQRAEPWRLWLGRNDLLCLAALTTGGQQIGLDSIFLEPANPRPGYPFTSVELDRSTDAAFGGYSQTPQRAITLTGTWGFTADADPAGQLASAAGETDGAVTVSDGSQVSAGDIVIPGYGRGPAPFPGDPLGHAGAVRPYLGERCLVRDVAFTLTGQAQTGPGCSTEASADNQLEIADGTQVHAGETLLLDAERMLALQVAGNVVTVQRAWDGTVLGEHSGAQVQALRALQVERGALGTTAQAWPAGTAVFRHRVPSPVRELAIALALDTVLQQTSGYARTVGAGDNSAPAPGQGVVAAWQRAGAYAARRARTGVI